jgi:ferrous iron transport protein A
MTRPPYTSEHTEGAAVSDTSRTPADTSAHSIVPPVCETCTLDCVRKGDRIEIISVDDSDARVQALRFGVCEGANVECVTKIPAGPLVIKSGRQEIAVGRSLAKRINVRRLA